MLPYGMGEKVIVRAKIKGKVIIVDFVSQDRNSYGDMNVEYLGKGKYHSYNGQPAKDKKIYHFWKWKTELR